MSETERAVPRRIAQAILNSLQSGVVPRVGLPYIAVGRKEEIAALLRDTELIAEGGASRRHATPQGPRRESQPIQSLSSLVLAPPPHLGNEDRGMRHQGRPHPGHDIASFVVSSKTF